MKRKQNKPPAGKVEPDDHGNWQVFDAEGGMIECENQIDAVILSYLIKIGKRLGI